MPKVEYEGSMLYESSKFAGNLHALRGLAAVSVVFYHAKNMGARLDVGSLGIVEQFGAGVTLFFILSGFSLALSNADRTERPGWLRGYAIRRMARILPVWAFFIAVHLVFQYIMFGKTYGPATIAANLIPMFALVPGGHESIVWAGWTIGVEVLFYILLPFLLVLNGRNLWPWLLTLIVALLLSKGFRDFAPQGLKPSYYYMGFQHQLFVFVLGSTLFFVILQAREACWARALAGLLFVTSIIGFVWWTLAVLRPTSFGMGGWATAVKAASIGGLVGLFYLWQDRVNIFNAATKFLGDKSYTIYLTHPIVISVTKPSYGWIAKAVSIAELSFLIYVSLVLAITFVVASVISNLIEEPIYRRGCEVARRTERHAIAEG